jgi:hypothetical protein
MQSCPCRAVSRGRKGRDGRGLDEEEESMFRLITRSELTRRSNNELAAIFRQASDALAQSAPGSPGHRNALASLENIARERAARMNRPRV